MRVLVDTDGAQDVSITRVARVYVFWVDDFGAVHACDVCFARRGNHGVILRNCGVVYQYNFCSMGTSCIFRICGLQRPKSSAGTIGNIRSRLSFYSSRRVGCFGLGFALVDVGVWAPTSLSISANRLPVVRHIEVSFDGSTDDVCLAERGIRCDFTYHVVRFRVEHDIQRDFKYGFVVRHRLALPALAVFSRCLQMLV